MTREVSFRPDAKADLRGLYDHIANEAGAATAGHYVDQLAAACLRLRDFPERGRRRDDIAPGLRTIAFERRVLIAYRVLPGTVEIVAILYGGRALTPALGDR